VSEVLWRAQPGPQEEFFRRNEFECLYGGQAGGGKTDALIMMALRRVSHPKSRVLLVRRTFPQLQEIKDRMRGFYPRVVPGADFKSTENRWYFPSGAIITLGHMQNEDDRYNYQGRDFDMVLVDEATQLIPNQYLYLFSRCRSKIPELPARVRCTANPGGPGHQFFKERFRIGLMEPRTVIWDEFTVPDTGEVLRISRVFLPASVYDNPALIKNDPAYIARLMQLPEIERKRLLYGEWDAFEGQALPELSREVHGHQLRIQDVPPEWPVFRAFDWGYSKPFVVAWFACDWKDRVWMVDVWYGTKDGEMDVGLKMTASEIGRQIRERERQWGRKISIGPADPSIWNRRPQKDGSLGISVQEEMGREGVQWIKADNNRVLGRQQIHERLKLDEQGEPGLYLPTTGKDAEVLWKSLQSLIEHPNDPEDIVQKNTWDHGYDLLRYALMYRPSKPKSRPMDDAGSFMAERRKLIKAKKYATRHGIGLSEAYGRTR
jgi:hypothetical protein